MNRSISLDDCGESFACRIAVFIPWMMLLWVVAVPAPGASGQTSNEFPGAEWAQFHRDNMQRWNQHERELQVNNVGGLALKWTFATGAFVESSPAVLNGVIYIGSDDGNLYALNASTGQKLWSFSTGAGQRILDAPALADGVVYIGSYDGVLYALNANTGKRLWSFSTGPNPIVGPPTVVDGVVYVSGGIPETLYALNAATGKKLWMDGNWIGGWNSAAVANGVVYIGSFDNSLRAINARTGAVLWSYAVTDGFVDSSPAVANGVVYIGGWDGTVYALKANNGKLLWSYETGSVITSSPAVADGAVYIGSWDTNVYALDARKGTRIWSFTTGDSVESSPAVANGVVYVGSDDFNLYALNAKDGQQLWSYPTKTFVESSPAVVDGVVYAAGGIGHEGPVFAFAPGDTADLFLRILPSTTTVHQGDLITFAFPVWNLGPANSVHEVLRTQVPAGTAFDHVTISGTPGLATCKTPPLEGKGAITCRQNGSMAPHTTWTVRLTVKVTAPSGTVIAENAATLSDTTDPNLANNTATVSTTVQ
jgi:outer membrane protein assembly factor BamB